MGGYSLAFLDSAVKLRYRQFRANLRFDAGLRDLVLTVLSDPQPDYNEKFPVPSSAELNPTEFDVRTVGHGDYFAVRTVDGITYQFLYLWDRGIYKGKKVVMTNVDVIEN